MSTVKSSSPLAPDAARDQPVVAYKREVLKLGMDGSSLPRLVVVTDSHVYICLPSGGITRTIAVSRIERVTLCPREDEHETRAPTDAPTLHDQETETSGQHGERQKSSGSFLASLFSSSSSKSKAAATPSTAKGSASRREKESASEKHKESPATAAATAAARSSTAASLAERNSATLSAGSSSNTTSAAEWAVIVTLGIALEPPLALQFSQMDDGDGFVSALRASAQISEKAVFNTPAEDGPTNAAGEQLFAAPARREDAVVPRTLERDGDNQTVENAAAVASLAAPVEQEVELSPSSPRSLSAAAIPPSEPLTNYPALEAQLNDNIIETNQEDKGEENRRAKEVDSSQKKREESRPSSSASSASSSSTSSPTTANASRAHTAEPDTPPPPSTTQVDAVPADALPNTLATPAPTSLINEAPPAHDQHTAAHTEAAALQAAAGALPSSHAVTQPSVPEKEEPADGQTPTPLRAAPHRPAPQPPLQAAQVLTAGHEEESAPLEETDESIRRVLYTDDAEGQALLSHSAEAPKTTGLWERIRDGHTAGAYAADPPSSSSSAYPVYRNSDSERRPGSLPLREIESEGSRGHSAAPHASSREANYPAVRTPPHSVGATQAEQQQHPQQVDSTTLHQHHYRNSNSNMINSSSRSISPSAHDALLRELAQAKAEVRALRAALSERDAQCAEWQSAYTHAEEHIGALRRGQAHELAAQEAKLRQAHRAELEAVQEAFEDYDARMTSFVDQLQRDHRDEAAQWQHERRTLLHQLEEQRSAQREQLEWGESAAALAAQERARAVAEAAVREARQRQQRSLLMPAGTGQEGAAVAYLDPRAASPSPRTHPSPRASVLPYANARERVQAKVDVYVAQQQQQQQRRKPAGGSAPSPVSPRPQSYAQSASASRLPAHAPPSSSDAADGSTPWPQPRSPVVYTPQPHLYDNLRDEPSTQTGRPPAADAHLPRRRRDVRTDSLIQTPPSFSLEYDGGRGGVTREGGAYVPHRRTFL